MSTSDELLRASLGLPSKNETTEDSEEPRVALTLNVEDISSALKVQDNDAAADYIKARSLLYAQITLVGNLTAEAGALAQQTLNPRAFEAYVSSATLLRTLTQDLLSMQKVFKDIKRGDEVLEKATMSQTTTNTVSQTFVGTPAELAELVRQTNERLDRDALIIDAEEK